MFHFFVLNTILFPSIDLASWNVEHVTDMRDVFHGATAFNGDITTWVTSSVTSFQSMFNTATVFNQDISKWIVSKARGKLCMNAMFASASAFNQGTLRCTAVFRSFDDLRLTLRPFLVFCIF